VGPAERIQTRACVRGKEMGTHKESEMIDFLLGVLVGLIAGLTIMHLFNYLIDRALPRDEGEWK